MAPPALIEETRFSTGDPEEAREFMADTFGDNHLKVEAPIVGHQALSIHRLDAPKVNVSNVISPSEFELTMEGRDDEFLLTVIHEGEVTIDHKGWCGQGLTDLGAGDVTVTNHPGVEWVHRSHPVDNTTIGISSDLLREAGGVDPETNDAPSLLSTRPRPERVGLWLQTARFLEAVLTEPAVAEAPLVIAEAQRAAAAAAVTVFPNNLLGGRQTDGNSGRDAHPEIVRRAVAFIESQPRKDMSVADVARAAHSGPRALQVAFRRHLDTTPMSYLRSVRLHHARQELLTADPGRGDSVTAIAMRWGFGSPSRFARLYRNEYGELPSRTLRR